MLYLFVQRYVVAGMTAGGRKVDLFVQAQILNVFNTSDMCGCGSTVFSGRSGSLLHRGDHPAVVEDVGAGEVAGPVAGTEGE